MHRAVNHRCFEAQVLLDASPQLLSAAFNVPPDHITQVWLADLDISSPSAPHTTQLSQTQQTPMEQVERHQQLPSMLDRNQFIDLFVSDDPMHDPDVLAFAQSLIAELSTLVGRAEPESVDPATQRSLSYSLAREALQHSSSASSAGMLDSSGSSPDERCCGFRESGSHADVQVLCGGLAIRKTGGGLYRTARSANRLHPAKSGTRHLYFEVIIVEDCDAGGICVGVTTDELPLNKLLGSNATSIGLHSSGQIVSRGGEFRDFARSFSRGDRVGCQVSIGGGPGADMSDEGEERYVVLRFCINGEWQGCVREQLGNRFANGEAELYAAVSLYKKESTAVIQCCQKDWALEADHGFCSGQVEAVCTHSF